MRHIQVMHTMIAHGAEIVNADGIMAGVRVRVYAICLAKLALTNVSTGVKADLRNYVNDCNNIREHKCW